MKVAGVTAAATIKNRTASTPLPSIVRSVSVPNTIDFSSVPENTQAMRLVPVLIWLSVSRGSLFRAQATPASTERSFVDGPTGKTNEPARR